MAFLDFQESTCVGEECGESFEGRGHADASVDRVGYTPFVVAAFADQHSDMLDTLDSKLNIQLPAIQNSLQVLLTKNEVPADATLNAHLPAILDTLLAELSKRDQYARNAELKKLIEELFEKYLGTQRVSLPDTSSSATSSDLRNAAAHLSKHYQSQMIQDYTYPIERVQCSLDVEWKIKTWYPDTNSRLLSIQTRPEIRRARLRGRHHRPNPRNHESSTGVFLRANRIGWRSPISAQRPQPATTIAHIPDMHASR